MRSSLALLLAIAFAFSEDPRGAGSSIGTSKKTGLGENVGQVGIERATSAGSEDGVGMVDICAGEILDRSLEGSEGDNDLCSMLSNCFGSVIILDKSSNACASIRECAERAVQQVLIADDAQG